MFFVWLNADGCISMIIPPGFWDDFLTIRGESHTFIMTGWHIKEESQQRSWKNSQLQVLRFQTLRNAGRPERG